MNTSQLKYGVKAVSSLKHVKQLGIIWLNKNTTYSRAFVEQKTLILVKKKKLKLN